MIMIEKLFARATRVAAIAAFLGAIGAQNAGAEPEPGARRARGGFNLFASSTVVLIGNRVQCGLDNQGNTCTDVFGSPTGGGGFWPKDTPNQYIFNSGLQIAGILPPDVNPSVWAGDTVGAYIFDARGTQPQGEQLTLIFESLTASDVDNWPAAAFIRNPAIYNPALVGRKTISQQDSWVRYWDGNPALLSGRSHPMGIMIEQRTLAWNFPSGNQDIIYFIYDFTNISSSNPADYAASFPDPAIAAGVAAIGAQYQAGVASVLGVTIPAGGYRIDSVYAAFSIDPDVGDAATNASTVILPFQMGIAYKTDFTEPTWFFPSDINGAPFGPYPGYVGIKYLKSPIDPATGNQVGLTMFSNTLNLATGFPDPVGVSQLWRYLSGRVDPLLGDNACTVANPIQSRLCFLFQAPADTRFYQSSGPFSLNAGESATIVVAAVHAAPLAAPILPFVGGVLAPGIPATGAEIFADPSLLRVIDLSAGWAGQNDANGNGIIEQDEVVATPRSLLAKALVAQSIFDSQFLLPFAPETPDFFVVPGDNQVTLVWSPSNTETIGDPYFDIASDPTSPLFDPNYRQLDVEGYRVYRGRTAADLELIAQFDYAGTSLVDFIGAWDYGTTCAPEIGVSAFSGINYAVPPQCPVDFTAGGSVSHDLSGDIPQVTLPGRDELASGQVVLLPGKLDETWPDFVAGGGIALSNTGVPFAFVDQGVINSITYTYAITSFDVNSVNSGPPALESSVIGQRATPRAASPTETLATLITGVFGDDGTKLDLLAPLPTLDADDGRWSGPFPPTNAFTLGFAPDLPRLLPEFTRSATIDRINLVPVSSSPCPAGNNPFGACWEMHLSVDVDGTISQTVVDGYTPWWNAFGEPGTASAIVLRASVDLDATSLAQFGIPTDAGFAGAAAVDLTVGEAINTSVAAGPHSRRGGSPYFHDGSRWIDGDTEQGATAIPDPSRYIRVGQVSGVDTVWAPVSHTPADFGLPAPSNTPGFEKQCFVRATNPLGRAADTRFVWGGGTFSEVRDITHHVDVQFNPRVGPTWGFVADGNGNGFIDWQDFNFIDGALQVLRQVGGGTCDQAAGTSWDPAGTATATSLSNTPTLGPTSTQGLDLAGVATLTATGTGFGLYVNGERFIFETGTLPADGTTWTLRQFWGAISVADGLADDPSGYEHDTDFGGAGGVLPRSMMVPGLTFNFSVATSTQFAASTAETLENVHTVPDPYYVTNFFETTPSSKILKFVNLPPQAIIRIYSVSGILVDIIEHNDIAGGGETVWDVRNRNEQFVASGVYFYHLETPEGLERVGRFTVVNSSGLPSATGN